MVVEQLQEHQAPIPDERVQDNSRTLVPNIDDTKLLEILSDFQNMLHPNAFKLKFCHVCSRMSETLAKIALSNFNEEHFLLSAAVEQLQLANPPTVTSRDGFTYLLYELCSEQNEEYCNVCEECSESILKSDIPLFSIPNACFPEPKPECMDDLSIVETLMISKIYPRSVIYQHRMHAKGVHSYMKGHCVSFENDINNMVTILPRTNEDLNGILRIVLVGDFQGVPNLPKVNTVNA
ncbi:hypothetical protein HDV02_006251, partial [Globomyces sp. JEL0801]